MHRRYEVWRYSQSWNKWLRDIYRDPEEAQARYEFLLRKGKKAKPPRPFNSGVPIFDRVGFAMSSILGHARSAARGYSRLGR